jgi:hypothetical protein
MSDGLTASSRRDVFARCFATRVAALDCVGNAVAAGLAVADHVVAVVGSDPASVVAAAPVVAAGLDSAVAESAVPVAGFDPASAAEPALAADPDFVSVVAEPVVAADPDFVSVVAEPVVAADPDCVSAAAVLVVAADPDFVSAAAVLVVAADPDSAFADQAWLDPSLFAAGHVDLACHSCSPGHRQEQRFQESTTTQLN